MLKKQYWDEVIANSPRTSGVFTDAVTGFGDGVFYAITFGNGFGQGWGLNEIRNYYGIGGVNTSSGYYSAGHTAGAIEGSVALSGALAVKYAGFRYDGLGRWKSGGAWVEGRHFHLGTGSGLQKHHLPQQLGNWWRNFKGLMR